MKSIDGLKFIPFSREDNTYNYSDKYLRKVFRTIVMERTAHKVFYDGSVKNGDEFISFLKRNDLSVFFVTFKEEDVGFFWLSRFVQQSAFINYCFYRSFWGKESLKISQGCIDYVFHIKDDYGKYSVNVLLGITPANNKLAIRFLQKNGMVVLGNIPRLLKDYKYNTFVDGVLSYTNRTKFKERAPSIISIASLINRRF